MINLRAFSGMEAINFQSYSAIGRDLTKVFQEVIDYRDSLDYEGVNPTWEARARYRDTKLLKFCKEVMVPKLIDTLKKDLNLEVDHVVLIHTPDAMYQKPAFLFGTTGCISKSMTSLGRHYRASGWGSEAEQYYNKAENDVLEDIESLATLLDLKSGGLTKNPTTKPLGVPVFIEKMFFDITTAFLIQDFTKVKDDEILNASELAAIYLHEIGHIMATIEHSQDLYMKCSRIRNNLVTLVEKGKLNEAATALRALDTKVISKLSSASEADQDLKGKLVKFCIKLSAALGTVCGVLKKFDPKDEGSLAVGTTATIVINTLVMLVKAVLVPVFSIIGLALTVYLSAFTNANNYLKSITNEKISDRTVNSNNIFLQERWADEYAARCGYGDKLASGLSKFEKLFKKIDTPELISYRPVKEICLYNALVAVMSMWCNTWYSLAHVDSPLYEAHYARLRRILQNSKAIFKNDDIGAELATEWIERCENIKMEMERNKSLSDTDFMKALINTIKNLMIVHPDNLYNLIVDGKLSRDCALLENRLDDMSNTDLYMLSHKFKTLTY